MSVLQVEELSKSFGGLGVLNKVSFSVGPLEKLALIGPNGAGKSTLINVIGGQLTASGGHVVLDGKHVTGLPANKRLHLGLGRSFQTNNLFFTLPVLDNVLLALHGAEHSHFHFLKRLARREGLLEEAERLLHAVGLWERRFKPLHVLSYGDQRLVELLCAFASKPRVVLLDEPTAGLPTVEAFAYAEIIRQLSADTALLFCAHDMDLVFSLADRIMVLYFGEILVDGLPQEISSHPKVQEIYLGSENPVC